MSTSGSRNLEAQKTMSIEIGMFGENLDMTSRAIDSHLITGSLIFKVVIPFDFETTF